MLNGRPRLPFGRPVVPLAIVAPTNFVEYLQWRESLGVICLAVVSHLFIESRRSLDTEISMIYPLDHYTLASFVRASYFFRVKLAIEPCLALVGGLFAFDVSVSLGLFG